MSKYDGVLEVGDEAVKEIVMFILGRFSELDISREIKGRQYVISCRKDAETKFGLNQAHRALITPSFYVKASAAFPERIKTEFYNRTGKHMSAEWKRSLYGLTVWCYWLTSAPLVIRGAESEETGETGRAD